MCNWAAPVKATGTVRKRQAVLPVPHVLNHTCRVTLLQPARRAAVLGQPSSLPRHWIPLSENHWRKLVHEPFFSPPTSQKRTWKRDVVLYSFKKEEAYICSLIATRIVVVLSCTNNSGKKVQWTEKWPLTISFFPRVPFIL
jgi:hypothetical protein